MRSSNKSRRVHQTTSTALSSCASPSATVPWHKAAKSNCTAQLPARACCAPQQIPQGSGPVYRIRKGAAHPHPPVKIIITATSVMLSQIENVDYVKESSGDVSRVREIHRLSEERITVFAGYHAFDSFLLGAKGYVSVCGNIVPKLSADLYRLVITESD